MSAVDLLPCPFCGGDARYQLAGGIICNGCGAGIPCRGDDFGPWNRRAPVSAGKVKALVERLRSYDDAWGDLPSIPPHSATAPGYTTGRVLLDVLEAARILTALQPGDGWQGITRVDLIDHSEGGQGVAFTKHGISVSLDVQDDGRTLKVFVAPPSALSQEGRE